MAEAVLDLRAIEAQLGRQLTHSARCYEAGAGCLCGSERALVEVFAHCRALRAALQSLKEGACWCAFTRAKGEHHSDACRGAAAVLATTRDGETP